MFLGEFLKAEADSILCAVGGSDGWVGAGQGLGAWCLAGQLGTLVGVEGGFQGGDVVGGDAAPGLLEPADGGHLGDDGLQAAVGGSEHDRVSAGTAGYLQSDPVGVDFGASANVPARRRSAIWASPHTSWAPPMGGYDTCATRRWALQHLCEPLTRDETGIPPRQLP
ncbi:hypothetical protein SBI_00069 [Streptomyces bingchenggensis BCW-1]|uniref:Uncharacterized protein n=1 Tax=Streptomyces bingchenggensis (strain BCW-1) TaxID=749414 RepID=D7BUJ9_STRBB|nr:hypothetical protein SBI_00069 [Streptomyces bingchenggensis BCW-1]